MIVHATPEDLDVWTGEVPPANAAGLLRSASLLVDRTIITATYVVDGDGRATDSTILGALRDATCAQAAAWAAAGIDPAAGVPGAMRQVRRKSLGSGTVEYEPGASQAAVEALGGLTPDAVQILAHAGLMSGAVWLYG